MLEKSRYCKLLCSVMLGLLCSACVCEKESQTQISSGNWQYAAFYAELSGDLITPIGEDTPARYIWTTADNSFSTGVIDEIWKHLNIKSINDDSYNRIEMVLINQMVSKGWSLVSTDLNTVPTQRKDLQTVYRYLFRRHHTQSPQDK